MKKKAWEHPWGCFPVSPILAVLLGSATALLATSGCGDTPGPASCPPAPPAGFGTSCASDGECPGYLGCDEDRSCGFPAAMLGRTPEARVEVVGGDLKIPVEVAAGELARGRGLAGRPCVQPGWGLLLMWPEPTEVAITMAEMAFDLALVFVDGEGVVVDVQRGRAGEGGLYRADARVRWVLEVEPVTVGVAGIEVGGRLSFEGLPE